MSEQKRRITSTEIKLALAETHKKRGRSYFITECKTCSTYFPDPQGLLIFDGLAITKSYTSPNIIGYEIKVSRADFLQDNKWHLYLQYCNEFFFVVPKGLIRKEEIPENVGLIYYDPDTKGLRTAKKSLYRKIEEPVGLYKYIIFSRLEEDRVPFYSDRREYAEAYLENKANKLYVGRHLGSKLAEELQQALEQIHRLTHVEEELKAWGDVQELLVKYKILYWKGDRYRGWLTRVEEALKSSCPKDLDIVISSLEHSVETLKLLKKESSREND